MAESKYSPFDYLLNAMEYAAQQDEPYKAGYASKRQAVLEYVRKLEKAPPEGEPTEEMLDAGIDAFMAAAKEQANAVGRVPQSVALKAAYKAMRTAAYDKGVKK
jgi:hypothetical protein